MRKHHLGNRIKKILGLCLLIALLAQPLESLNVLAAGTEQTTEQTELAEQTERTTEQAELAEQTERTTEQTDAVKRTEQVKQTDLTKQAEQTGQSEQTGPSEQIVQKQTTSVGKTEEEEAADSMEDDAVTNSSKEDKTAASKGNEGIDTSGKDDEKGTSQKEEATEETKKVKETTSSKESETTTQSSSEPASAAEENTKNQAAEGTTGTSETSSEKTVTRTIKKASRPKKVKVQNGTTYQLKDDETQNGQQQINNGVTFTLDLAGHTLTMGSGSYFMINPGGTLNIIDSVGGGKIVLSTYLVWLYNGGTVNLGGRSGGKDGKSFTIDGSKEGNGPQMGGCIYFGSPMNADETVNMYEGVTIQNCKSTQYGGAVYVGSPASGHSCTFNMYGGTISNCSAKEAGGGVYVGAPASGKKSYFNMYGGSILNCSAREGGGIYVTSTGAERSEVYLKGNSKITLLGNTASSKGGAIYSDGIVKIEGILDIGHGKYNEIGNNTDSVYIDKNNWSGYVPEYLDVTGPLVVVGDGYIDLDTNYPSATAIVQGHTVVKNSAGLDPKVFYTYGSYFINSKRGLTVSAGFDPSKNSCTESTGPSNWHTYNSDTGEFQRQTFVDVMGQTKYVEATSEPGKREYQDYNYLIYTERSKASDPIREFYSIKMIKKDATTSTPLDGATFTITGKGYNNISADGSGTTTESDINITTPGTGSTSLGVDAGEAYFYTSDSYNQKLMLADGKYSITETQAPDNYTLRSDYVATIEITHAMDSSTGEQRSIVKVNVNETTLTNSDQVINTTYSDNGKLIEHEIVLTIGDTKGEIKDNRWSLQGVKYGRHPSTDGSSGQTSDPLSGAAFILYRDGTEEDNRIGTATSADGTEEIEGTDGTKTKVTKGTLIFYLEEKDSEKTDAGESSNGNNKSSGTAASGKVQVKLDDGTYYLCEKTAPAGYGLVSMIRIVVNSGNVTVSQLSGNDYVEVSNLATVNTKEKTISLSITDQAQIQLPSTGARGYTWAVILGIMVMSITAAAGKYLFMHR